MLTTVFNGLSPADRSRALFLAVGKESYSSSNQNFCQGSFPMVVSSSWWSAWGVAQRDIVTMRKDSIAGWVTHCRFSMNSYTSADVTAVVTALLASPAQSTSKATGSTARTATSAPLTTTSSQGPTVVVKGEFAMEMTSADAKTLLNSAATTALADALAKTIGSLVSTDQVSITGVYFDGVLQSIPSARRLAGVVVKVTYEIRTDGTVAIAAIDTNGPVLKRNIEEAQAAIGNSIVITATPAGGLMSTASAHGNGTRVSIASSAVEDKLSFWIMAVMVSFRVI